MTAKTPRQKAEELAMELYSDLDTGCGCCSGPNYRENNKQLIADTIEPLLEEIEAMQSVVAVARMIQNQRPDVRMMHQLKRLDEYRKRNEEGGV